MYLLKTFVVGKKTVKTMVYKKFYNKNEHSLCF